MTRMTNAELADAAAEYKECSKAEARKKELGPQILAELNRRGKAQLEVDGWKITRTSRTTNLYDVVVAIRRLGGLAKAAKYLKLDTKALKADIDAGSVPDVLSVAHAGSRQGAPYPVITPTADAA